jgi:class 3 adenylate cyclase
VKPQTRYARSGDVYIGYQVFGDGPFDLVVVPGAMSNIEYGWELDSWQAYYGGFASFARVLLFDKRGTGISDPVTGAASLEERMDDVRAVMDAVGSERAALMGGADGAAMVALFAATYPERAAALVLNNPMVRGAWAPDYPWGVRDDDEEEFFLSTPDEVEEEIALNMPSRRGDKEFAEWLGSYMRLSASPSTAQSHRRMNLRIDVREVLGAIRTPTLVTHYALPGGRRIRSPVLPNDPDASHYVAHRIPGARLIELSPGDLPPWTGDAGDAVTVIGDFLLGAWDAGAWEPPEPDRVLATLLFTDIVDSTARAAELGDAHWRALVEQHHATIRRQLVRFRGREVDTAGDGFFASFDGPARAVRCACSIAQDVDELGLQVRAGLHSGECELIDGKIGGIAVALGARVAATAEPGEVRVSRTVRDLVAGSGLEFDDRGRHELRGAPGDWELFAVRR